MPKVYKKVKTIKRVSNNLLDTNILEIHNGFKQGDALSPLLVNILLKYAILIIIKKDKEELIFNGLIQLFVYADDVVISADHRYRCITK